MGVVVSGAVGAGHYGEWISAHVAGELSRAQEARLQVHLLQCAPCAREVAEERAARSLLLTSAGVEPSADLTARLVALGCAPRDAAATGTGTDEIAPGAARRGATGAPLRAPRARSWGRRPVRRVELATLRPGDDSPTYPALTGELGARRNVAAVAVVAGVVGLGLGAGVLAVIGAPPRVVPSAHPAEALTTLSRTIDAGAPVAALGGAAAVDPAATDPVLAGLREDGWYVPRLAAGMRLVGHHLDGEGRLEIELGTAAGSLVLREQVGTLDRDALAQAPTVTWGAHTVHVLSQTPWHVAWQTGDLVLEAYGSEANPVAETIVTAPDSDVDAPVAVGRRIARGWDSVLTVVSGR